MRSLGSIGILQIASLSAAVGAAVSQPGHAESEQPFHGGGVGLVCIWALVNAAAEGGRRCRAGHNPPMQIELEHTVRRIDDYVLRNSDMTQAAIARFKTDQLETGSQDFCNIAGGFFDIYARAGPDRLRREIDSFLAARPRVEWGTCL